MKKVSTSHHGALNELNITPLLDLAFVLLVIFIITTPQLVNHLEMTLPSGESRIEPPPPDAPKPALQRIRLENSGTLRLNGDVLTLAALRATLDRLRTALPELAIVVEAADDVRYQNMIAVLDLLRQLDISRVGLATTP